MDPRLPHHIEPGTFVVIDGPEHSGAAAQMDKLWQAAHGLGHGTTPLLDHLPVFTAPPQLAEHEATHWEQVVAPALTDGAVFMLGRYVTDAGRQADVTFIVNPVEPLADHEIPLLGDDGEVGESLFAELIDRGFYSGRQSGRARR
jgi:hypothetical protein